MAGQLDANPGSKNGRDDCTKVAVERINWERWDVGCGDAANGSKVVLVGSFKFRGNKVKCDGSG